MRAFINGIGCVSPQRSWERGSFPEQVQEYHARMIQCQEPEVDTGLDEKYTRRMNRLIRLGWTASKICLDDAGNPHPDAIITGSGWGSVQDSEKFLLSIYKNKESFLPPTPFIQSTHNALGSQIAILLESFHYNMAYAHSGFAFEQAVEDALIRLENKESRNILVGGFDEITDNQFILYDRAGWWRKEPASNLSLIDHPAPGSLSGEGYSFFLLSDERKAHTYAEVDAVVTGYADNPATASRVRALLKDRRIDWVLAGLNGDQRYDPVYHEILGELFPGGVPLAAFKHLCGEYLTASGFAMWAAAHAIREQRIPGVMKINPGGTQAGIDNILIFNLHKGQQCSFILLSKPK